MLTCFTRHYAHSLADCFSQAMNELARAVHRDLPELNVAANL